MDNLIVKYIICIIKSFNILYKMSNYGRVPNVNMEITAQVKEDIFVKEKQKKEFNLKKHLAECRKKSIAVRKAKAEEKRKNKKPRGRPKKVQEKTTPQPAPVVEEVKEVIEKINKPEVITAEINEMKENRSETVSVENENPFDYSKIVDMLYEK